MKDIDKTKEQLISELKEMRQRIAELDALTAERKQVGKALQKSERRYRLLADNAADVIWTVGLDMRLTYISPSIVQLLGYSVEEAMVKTMKEVFTPASFEVAMKVLAEELSIEKMEQKDLPRSRMLEFELKRKDGSIVPVEIGYSFLRGADAQPVEILAIARDITERKQAEEALRQSEEKLRLMFESATDGIVVTDLNGNIMEMNEAAVRLRGSDSKEKLIGQNIFELIAEKDRVRVMEILKNALEDGQIRRNVEITFLTEDGREYFAEVSSALLKDAAGNSVGFIAIFRDITERKLAEEKLRKRNDFIETILDNLPIGLAVNTVDDGVARYLNKAFETIYGWPKEDLVSVEEFFNHVYPDPVYRKELKEKILSDIASGDATRMKWENLIATGKDGKQRVINGENIPLLEQNMMISTVQDTTERKQAEEALRESRAQMQAILDGSPDRIRQVDTDLKVLWANQAVLNMNPDVLGQPCYKVVVNRDKPCEGCPALKAFKTGQIERGEMYQPFVTGVEGEYYYEHIAVPTKDNDGKVIGTIQIIRDITERKEAEEKIKRAAEEWRTTFDSITDLVSIHDKDFRLIRVNKAFAYAFNMKPKELIGKTCYQVVHGANEPMPGCPHVKTLETKKPAIGEFFAPHLGIHFEAMASPIFDEKGEVMASVHITRDLTERKRMEAERKELEQKAQVTSRLATVGEMASGIAHEINNPLTSVIGFAELLMRRDLPEDIKNDLEIIHTGARRVASIINRLLTFARQRKPERTYANINEVIETTIELRAYELETGNIKVATHLDPDLPQTMTDTGQLQQVFLNIILNAETEMKTAHGKGNLVVKTERVDDTIRISFKDDGPGIAKENLEKVFDPFFTTREVGTGTGLGLSICHGIVAEHKGRLYVKSQLGKGATFIIELPVVTEARQLELVKPTDESEKIRVDRILVVDDESAVLQFFDQLLTGEGYEVETAETASDALKRIKSKDYGVLLLDIKLPDMNGTELYRRIQKIAPSLAERVVFVTGDVMGARTTEFLAKTKVPYITKPIDTEQLMERINSMLSYS